MSKQSLMEKLKTSDLMDEKVFKDIMKEADSLGLLPHKELANEFEVHDSSIKRWVSGIAIPLPRFRKLILTFIKSHL